MAMRALDYELEKMSRLRKSSVIRQIDVLSLDADDMDLFMRTFDTASTVGENYEWDMWARKNKVLQLHVGKKEDPLLSTILGLSPWLKDPSNKVELIEATYLVNCINHNGEEEYLKFFFFLLSHRNGS